MERELASWTRPQALAALDWLVGAGADIVVSDEPRSWLKTPHADRPKERPSVPEPRKPAVSADSGVQSDTAPAALIVEGDGTDRPLLLFDADPIARNGTILGDEERRLVERMMAAIGLDVKDLIRVGIDRTASPPMSALRQILEDRRPPRVLLFGDGPSQTLLGMNASIARGRVHQVDLQGAGVTALSTLSPRLLLQQPRQKALAWADLRLFMKAVSSQ